MALNLWKLGGKSTAYNPLPNGYTDLGLTKTGSMRLKFKAKSQSKANLRVFVSVSYALNTTITLTEDLKDYEFDFFYNQIGVLSFQNVTNAADIVIESIELVQKPLPKLTINGIDGFNSGKWVLNSSLHTVINDETLELNATALSQNAYILVDVIPNTVYTYGLEEGLAAITTENASSFLLTPYASGFRSFNTGNNSKIRCYLSNASVGTGRFIFKRPMLNLGSTPAPYSKKTGERMIEHTPVKNLLNMLAHVQGNTQVTGALNSGITVSSSKISYSLLSGNLAWGNGYPQYLLNVKPNTNYVFKMNVDKATANMFSVSIKEGFLNSNANIANATNVGQGECTLSFNSGNRSQVVLQVYPYYQGEYEVSNLQLEEGSIATKYEPYNVQLNPKAKRLVPKKNLLGDTWKQGNTTGASLTTRISNDFTEVQQKPYVFSLDNSYSVWLDFFDQSKTPISSSLSYQVGEYRFTPSSNIRFVRVTIKRVDDGNISISDLPTIKPQLEQGSTATPYEPYQLITPRAETGLRFNGDSYLQLPLMTMDSIEVECLIDSEQINSPAYFIDARTGLPNSEVHSNGMNSGWAYFYVNDVSKTKDVSNIPRNERVKLKFGSNTPFADDVTIFCHSGGAVGKTEGTLYKVTCYLEGAIVAQYDFENPSNIVGDKVLLNSDNLIPSFEDSRWNLHANFKVLGERVGRLDATIGSTNTLIYVPVSDGKTYQFLIGQTNGLWRIYKGIWDGISGGLRSESNMTPFQVDSSFNGFVTLHLTSGVAGSFDFINPQLCELTGREGTVVGKPTPLVKKVKRILYEKR